MRRAHPAGFGLALRGLALGLAFGTPAFAIEPDDLPWEVQDYIDKHKPGSIEDILEREGLRDPGETEIGLPGQDQPDLMREGDRAVDNDRLEPNLPPVETRKELGDKPPAQAALPAASEELKPNGIPQPAAQTIGRIEPAPGQGGSPEIVRPLAGTHQPARELTAPTPIPTRDTATAAREGVPSLTPTNAATVPPVIEPRAPAGHDIARTPHPVPVQNGGGAVALSTQEVVPHDPQNPPLAVPSEPVSKPVVAVNGKLYLPLQYYFERKAAVTLADYDLPDRTALAEFYLKNAGEALWVTQDGFNEAAAALVEEIKRADEWGLSAEDYKIPGLTKISAGPFSDDDLADAEIKLSLVAMEYARHARGDRIMKPAEQLSSYLDRKPQLVERPKLIADLAAAQDKAAYLRSLHPKHEQFDRLREKLLAFRKGGVETGPEPIPEGPKITPGKVHWQVRLVREHLKTAPPAQKSDGTPFEDGYYDEALARAVVAYKKEKGLEPVNATITTALRRSLNSVTKPLDERTILANMEQWRWMPEDLGSTHIWVNIPEFLVRVKKDGAIIHEERIVAGKQETQTPVFSNRMRTVVFQPPWNVPESIKVNELLPSLRNGKNPIESQGLVAQRNGKDIDAWDIDWSTEDIRKFHIFQPPGEANVLGVVKFLFPNKHSVYLHDTPAKKLFNEQVRTFSHGCMRVRNPVQLAEVIMAEDKGWDKAKVHELVYDGPPDNTITLDKPMPVHVTYFTIWIGDDGQTKIFDDIYGHEQRIKLGLDGKWDEIQKNPDHLAPADPSAIVSNEDWDETPARPVKRSRPRYTYNDEPREYRRAPSTSSYKQVAPKKNNPTFSDFLNGVFGN